MLLTYQSLKIFRIVIEINSELRGERRLQAFRNIENLISVLNDFGCKVPVLIYSNITGTEIKRWLNKFYQFKKKYIMLFFTDNIEQVTRFCKMEDLVNKNEMNF